MPKKSSTFADEFEPTALATDVGKRIPILEEEAAEKFIKLAKDNEEKAKLIENKPITIEEAKNKLSIKKTMLEYEKRNIKELEKEIEKLENIINQSN